MQFLFTVEMTLCDDSALIMFTATRLLYEVTAAYWLPELMQNRMAVLFEQILSSCVALGIWPLSTSVQLLYLGTSPVSLECGLFEERLLLFHIFLNSGDRTSRTANEKLFRLFSLQYTRPLEEVEVGFIYNYLNFWPFFVKCSHTLRLRHTRRCWSRTSSFWLRSHAVMRLVTGSSID